MTTVPQLVLADDLSGAAETAACFGAGSLVRLWAPGVSAEPAAGHVCVLDLDTRRREAADAAAITAQALAAGRPTAGALFKKSDSLLRGNVAAELQPFLDAGRTVLVAPALPALGRTTRGGVIHIDDTPLHETALWAAETRAVPRTVSEALSPLDLELIPLADVRAGLPALRTALQPGRAYICDAETHADLARIAALATGSGAVLVGSAGVCRAISNPSPDLPGADVPWRRSCLSVIGTASPTAVEQAQLLRSQSGAALLCITLDDIDASATRERWSGAIAELLASGDLIVVVEPLGRRPRLPGPVVAAALAEIVRDGLGRAESIAPDLILTGGETARGVLDAIGVRELVIEGQVEPGAVVSRTPDDRYVATRPGSFGGPESLLLMRHAINRLVASTPATLKRP